MSNNNDTTQQKTKRERVWYTQRKAARNDRRQSLRAVERYAQDVVGAQPSPPRKFKTGMLLLQSLAPKTMFLLILELGLLFFQEYHYRNQPYAARPFNYYVLIALLTIVLLRLLWTDVAHSMYSWWYGVRYGRYTIAQITDMQERRIPYGGDVIDGQWRFAIDAIPITSHFRISRFWSGSWMERLEAGSEVHILVHPRTPHMVVPIGIVNDASPILIPHEGPLVLAELLASEPPKDST